MTQTKKKNQATNGKAGATADGADGRGKGSRDAGRPARDLTPSPSLQPAAEIPPAPLEGGPYPRVEVRVIRGRLPQVEAPVVIAARYERMPLAGPIKEFDHILDSWLSRAVELGMIGSRLGELFLVPLQRRKEAGQVKADNLLLVGMGEPGHFGRDDLRFLISNVTVAVKAMGHDRLSISLIGVRRRELSIRRAVQGLLEGVIDGYERFRGVLQGVKDNVERLRQSAAHGLLISLVEEDRRQARVIFNALKGLEKDNTIPGLELAVPNLVDDGTPPPDEEETAAPADLAADDTEMTLLQVTRNLPPTTDPAGARRRATETFQFSALGQMSAIPVREVEVHSHFVKELPAQLAGAPSAKHQEDFGQFFANFLIPDDFRGLIEGGQQLTLVLDESTASYPWEMAGFRGHRNTRFFGTDLQLTRQFRTLSAAVPGMPPPLNRALKVLVIADPAPGAWSLPGARAEGLAVAEVIKKAQVAWRGVFDLKVTVRIGSPAARGELAPQFEALRRGPGGDAVESATTCYPLETVMLLVNNAYDVVHYAGHGVFEPDAGRMGWVLGEDHILSAQEIFRVRQVPRLVFANACHSAVTEEGHERQRRQQVGLAQAFFARGIQNYIGTGWQVDDELARQAAVTFYMQVLAVVGAPKAPPATLGESLAAARKAIRGGNVSTTWGAYQHYGRANDKLLPFVNATPGEEA